MTLKTRDAIVDAAFAVLSTRPGASLAEVAEAAQVGRATLHRHFRSREDLTGALARQAIVELRAAVDVATEDAESHTEGLRLALEAIVPLGARQWFLSSEGVEKDAEVATMLAEDHASLLREIEAARAEGAFAPNVPGAWIVQAYDAVIYAAWTMVRREEATPRQAAELAWRTLTSGMGPAP